MTRLLLASKFPEQYIRETIVPNLRALGAEPRVVSTEFDGPIKDVDAVAFMFQYCSHSSYQEFKRRAKLAEVPFFLLTRQAAEWPAAFRKAGIEVKRPAPSVIVANGKPLIPPPPPAVILPSEPSCPSPPPPPISFGTWLKQRREQEEVTQQWVADLCDVDGSMVGHWENGRAHVAQEHLDRLTEIFGALPDHVTPPTITTRPSYRKPANPRPSTSAATPTAAPAPEMLVPVVIEPKANGTNGHKAAPLPLRALLRAARALGVTGPVRIEVDDGTTHVHIGDGSPLSHADPDEAVAAARAQLRTRLAEQVRLAQEAQAALEEA